MSFKIFTSAIALSIGLASTASAGVLHPYEILAQYNLVTAGDVTTTQEVEGRAYIGGNLSGSGFQVDYVPTAASDYADLIVIGDSTVPNINLSGSKDTDVVIGGTSTSNINNQTPGSTVTIGSLPSDLVPDFPVQTLMGLADQLSATASNASEAVTGQSNLLRLNAAPTAGKTIYDIDIADLNRGGIEVDLNGADLVVINVTGSGAINSNFQGGGFEEFATKAIWNFIDATDLEFKQFWGQVLAPFADVTNTSPIEGTLFANNVTLNGEIHLQMFDGDMNSFNPSVSTVPLPSGLYFLLSGLLVLGGTRRLASKS